MASAVAPGHPRTRGWGAVAPAAVIPAVIDSVRGICSGAARRQPATRSGTEPRDFRLRGVAPMSASVDRTTARTGRRPDTVWAWYALVCAAGIGLYFLLPSTTSQNVGFIVSNVIGAAAVLVGVARHRPAGAWAWRLFALYSVCTAAGNAIWLLYDSVLHISPFPSPGDAIFLTGYLVEAAGLLLLLRRRSKGRDVAALTDAAIITTGFAVATWVFLMSPLARDETLTLLGRVTSLGYPAADLLVLMIGARLFAGRVTRTGAFGLLGGTLVVQLVADAVFAVLNLAGTYHTGHPIDALILTYNLGLGAAALHPSMAALTDPQPPLSARVGWRRLAVLTMASLLAPVVLLGQIIAGKDLDLAVTASGGVLLFLLVLARMAGLVRTLDRTLASRQALERELEHLVHHDPLTGLANRRLFNDRLAGAVDTGAAPALLYMDLDGFKRTNDQLGHAAGDTLLTAVGARLTGCVRATDTVARLGGDEFAVLLPGADEAEAARVAMRCLDAFAEPVRIDGSDVQPRASIGIALGRLGQEPEQLMHHADLAMYRVKAAGTGHFEFFAPAS